LLTQQHLPDKGNFPAHPEKAMPELFKYLKSVMPLDAMVHFVFDPGSFNGNRHTTVDAATHEDGLLKSEDGGDSWHNLGLKGVRIFDMEIMKIESGLNVDEDVSILYLATEKGLFTVSDKARGKIVISKLGHDGYILPPDKYPDSYP